MGKEVDEGLKGYEMEEEKKKENGGGEARERRPKIEGSKEDFLELIMVVVGLFASYWLILQVAHK